MHAVPGWDANIQPAAAHLHLQVGGRHAAGQEHAAGDAHAARQPHPALHHHPGGGQFAGAAAAAPVGGVGQADHQRSVFYHIHAGHDAAVVLQRRGLPDRGPRLRHKHNHVAASRSIRV